MRVIISGPRSLPLTPPMMSVATPMVISPPTMLMVMLMDARVGKHEAIARTQVSAAAVTSGVVPFAGHVVLPFPFITVPLIKLGLVIVLIMSVKSSVAAVLMIIFVALLLVSVLDAMFIMLSITAASVYIPIFYLSFTPLFLFIAHTFNVRYLYRIYTASRPTLLPPQKIPRHTASPR